MNSDETLNRKEAAPKFGTFLGVYTPSVLTILGLIMYLRFGWVVGNLGLILTFLVVLIASSITFITGLSASAIATNMRVGVGGEYYMIAHSLGLEPGGAIGIPLYLCRTLSITFYSFGLAESIAILWPQSWGPMPGYTVQLMAGIIIILITFLSGKSAEIVLKLQIPIMIAVGLSLLALFAGIIISADGFKLPDLHATYKTAPGGFWYVFAIFFPAVTGFTAGIGMSGDLENPRKSIPRGTLWAVLTGALIYLTIPLMLSITKTVGVDQLSQTGAETWIKISIFGPLFVFAGMWGAILSSAFGSVLSGPRVLQALSEDGLAPRFLSKLSKNGQPTIATWITGFIALFAVLLGDLNAVAKFVTILFLTLYVIINLSAAIEKLVGDPSYRPTINVPWYISLLGSLGALSVMLLLNPLACLIAILLELSIYYVLRKKSLQKRWGDVRAGLWLSISRIALLKLKKHKIHPRNWRPHIIVFTQNLAREIGLVYIASCFNERKGIVTVSRIIEGDLVNMDFDIDELEAAMEGTLKQESLIAFPEVTVASDFYNGVINISQSNGIAGLHSNTIVFGWPRSKEKIVRLIKIMRILSRISKNTIITSISPDIKEKINNKRIDLWWGGLQNNGDLMLLFSHLLTLNKRWRKAEIVIHSIIKNLKRKEEIESSLNSLITNLRLEARTKIIVKESGETIDDIITGNSRNSDMVILGLMVPREDKEEEYARRMISLSKGLKSVIFVRNASKFRGSLI
jgi:amino acid transporter